MPEMKPVNFKPRWMQSLSPEDRVILANAPTLGDLPTEPPQVCTRILPRDNSCRLSAKTVSEAIDLTQNLVNYAGHDVYHGLNPDFADLRSLSTEVIEFSRLTLEPFEEGSFVIPARLEANPLEAPTKSGSSRSLTTDRVAQRFAEILEKVDSGSDATGVSIGALLTIKALGRVLRREAGSIEYTAFDSRRKPLSKLTVHDRFVERVGEVLLSRRPSHEKTDTLDGKVTALDVVDGTLLLTRSGAKRRVKGTFSPMLHPTLLQSLGKRVRLQGMVSQRGSTQTIQIVDVEILDSESL